MLPIKLFLALALFCSVSFAEMCVHEPDSLCFDATCAQPLFDKHVGKACVCNDDNIGEMWTDCDPSTNTRKLVYFWRPPATCLNGTLPPPVEGIPCDITCGAGEYLDLNMMQCEPCANGTFSVGAGHKWDTWNDWPAQFSTYCAIGDVTQNCSQWDLHGEYIDSGNNYPLSYLESILELRVKLVMPGAVTYVYKVSAEQGYDGIWFIVDDLAWSFVSNTDWTTVIHDLSPGYHTIQWAYYKDQFVTAGEDRASIRSISVTGLTYATSKCEECPIGHYQDEIGQSSCKDCPENTYNDQPGAAECKACDPYSYSYPGSTSCTTQRKCDSDNDYTYYLTPCQNGVQTKVYTWIQPAACDVTASTLPGNETLSCVPLSSCPPGMELVNGACQYCSPGHASDGTTACQTCLAGESGTPRTRYFSQWDSWPTGTGTWFSGCSGNCYTDSWRFGQWFIDSGLGHGPNTESWVSIAFDAYKGITLSFEYAVQCDANSSNVLTLSMNGYIIATFPCDPTCTTTTKTYSTPLFWFPFNEEATANYIIKWTYQKHDGLVLTSACDRAIITNVTLNGVANGVGGSKSCDPCVGGTFSTQPAAELCDICPLGTSSNPGSTSCPACLPDTVADKPGMPACLYCGANTVPTADHTDCLYNCSNLVFRDDLNMVDMYYDLSALGGETNVTWGDTFYSVALCSRSSLCGSHVCQSFPNFTGVIDVGRLPEITELPGHSGVLFRFSNGDKRGEYNCQTSVAVLCDPAEYLGNLAVDDMSKYSDMCISNLVVHSIMACPLCMERDYSYVETPCENGLKTRSYYWLTNKCWGGVSLPHTEGIPCSSEVSFYWRTVVIVTVTLSITGLSGAGALIYLYVKNKRLNVAYNALRSNAAVPLDETENSGIAQ